MWKGHFVCSLLETKCYSVWLHSNTTIHTCTCLGENNYKQTTSTRWYKGEHFKQNLLQWKHGLISIAKYGLQLEWRMQSFIYTVVILHPEDPTLLPFIAMFMIVFSLPFFDFYLCKVQDRPLLYSLLLQTAAFKTKSSYFILRGEGFRHCQVFIVGGAPFKGMFPHFSHGKAFKGHTCKKDIYLLQDSSKTPTHSQKTPSKNKGTWSHHIAIWCSLISASH